MYRHYNAIKIDPEKFMKWYREARKEYKITSAREFAAKIGYNQTFIANCRDRGVITVQACKLMELQYGLKLDDIKPDEKKPEPEPEKEEPKAVPQQVAVDLSKLEDQVRISAAVLTNMNTVVDDIKKGFRVQTNPRLDTESIAEGVYAGMSRFWERNKKDIIGQLRGLVFAGTFDAGKKLDEMKTDTKIWPVAK